MRIAVALLALLSAVSGQDEACESLGGQCLQWQDYICNGGWETGLCSGDADRRCCLPCDQQCQDDLEEWEDDDAPCVGAGGTCMDNSNYCNTYYEGGICGGPNDRQCCVGINIPDEEFRGMFVATVAGIDFPTDYEDSTASQQAQLDAYSDTADRINFNAIMFQIRPAADAFYDSPIEPWSVYLTGTQGQAPDPYYDPLEYIVESAHAVGVEVHVWLNPYRGALSPSYSGLSDDHICNVLREYCYVYGDNLWLDPGAAEVQDQLAAVIEDVLARYDVDGVHFDDYFYPYPNGEDFPDDATYNAYQVSGGVLSRDDWRRDNVNKMVERVHNVVLASGTGARFSISPFGLYKPGEPGGMPDPIVGLDPYSELYADSLYWLQQGWIDFLAPQLYWEIDPPEQSYPTLLDWWIDPAQNTAGRHIYAANALYQIDDSELNWPTDEIVAQVAISRDEARRDLLSLGNIHFSAIYLRDNYDGIADSMLEICPEKATIPPYDWLSKGAAPVVSSVAVVDDNAIEVIFEDESVVRKWDVFKVRRHGSGDLKLLATLPRSATSYAVRDGPGVYAVRGRDAANVAGELVFVEVE